MVRLVDLDTRLGVYLCAGLALDHAADPHPAGEDERLRPRPRWRHSALGENDVESILLRHDLIVSGKELQGYGPWLTAARRSGIDGDLDQPVAPGERRQHLPIRHQGD